MKFPLIIDIATGLKHSSISTILLLYNQKMQINFTVACFHKRCSCTVKEFILYLLYDFKFSNYIFSFTDNKGVNLVGWTRRATGGKARVARPLSAKNLFQFLWTPWTSKERSKQVLHWLWLSCLSPLHWCRYSCRTQSIENISTCIQGRRPP